MREALQSHACQEEKCMGVGRMRAGTKVTIIGCFYFLKQSMLSLKIWLGKNNTRSQIAIMGIEKTMFCGTVECLCELYS